MARPRSLPVRLLLAAAVAGACAAGWVAWSGRGEPARFLPGGAILAADVSGATDLLESLDGTRFAAAFAASSTREWLDRADAIRALDEVRTAVGRATGYTPGRRTILEHTLGRRAAVAWYRGSGGASRPWVAASRLSWSAWALASAGKVAGALGLLPSGSPGSEISGIDVLTVPTGNGAAVHLFTRGRTVVAASDRERIGAAARCAAGDDAPLSRDRGWREVRDQLPDAGDLFLFADGGSLPPAVVRSLGGVPRAAGALIRGGLRTEVHAYAAMASEVVLPREGSAVPGLALLRSSPLLLYATGGPAPQPVRALLASRARDAARAGATAGSALPPAGDGFAIAVTDAAPGGLFPLPRGVVVLGMGGDAEARDAVRLLFPPGARTARVRGATAFATRESLPLAGEFDLWGGSVGRWLVLGTSPDALAAVDAAGGGLAARELEGVVVPGRRLDAVAAIDVGKALPALRRYAPPLAGLLRARYRDVPDLARDLDLLGAVRSVSAFGLSAAEGPRALVTLQLGDLP